LSSSVRIPAPVRERRSHSERTAETKARIMAAVVESIDEVGFHKTTGAEISRRAGVSWGAVQHHYRDKDGILVAVLESSFDLFAERLGSPPETAASLEERVALFVDRAWSHFSSPEYRSTFEILRNLPRDLDSSWQKDLLRQWFEIWSAYFPERRSARERTTELLYFTFSALSGLAGTRMLDSAGGRLEASGLELLKETLRRGLGAEG
jgi:AcrR family transcriptional regulator